MDRPKQNSKKNKPKCDKEKSPSFIADVKALKENLKIRQILRTVKMNSSMRIKAPRGSKVMQNKDFNDNEDFFDDGQDLSDPPSATNPLVVSNNVGVSETSEVDFINNKEPVISDSDDSDENVTSDVTTTLDQNSGSLPGGIEQSGKETVGIPNCLMSQTIPPLQRNLSKARDRKLSLDHTMLSNRSSLSQSEMDLHSIGKLPLERKSSFFRKKMDSFFKNTTEIFKKQSVGSKSSQSAQRRGSKCSRMSVSLQSLNENEVFNGERMALDNCNHDELRDSMTSLQSSITLPRSNSSLSAGQSDQVLPDLSEEHSFADSRPDLSRSQPFEDRPSTSKTDLSETYNQETILHSRAISMSSGLDTARGSRKGKAHRSNRVTWVASETLTNYIRRLVSDEKATDKIQPSQSYQDFATIPEIQPSSSSKSDSKGRKLSYQRAVSGEDPAQRRKKAASATEGINELSNCLAEFSRSGVPPLIGFQAQAIADDALAYLLWAESQENLEVHYDWNKLTPSDQARQAVIKELIFTEADHIKHLKNIVEVYIAAAHALQDVNKLLDLDTRRLFSNIPDVLNANMQFWELVVYPMISDSFVNKSIFNTDLMAPGFEHFGEIFEPYENYVCDQSKAVDYLRALSSNTEFMTYLNWCHKQNQKSRLQLGDILVKPMQRLTKYNLLLQRIVTYTESEESKAMLTNMESATVTFARGVNRAIRKKEEIEKLFEVDKIIEPYEVEHKDEDMDRYFNMFKEINLKTPMVNCDLDNHRNIFYQAEFRFKDAQKEVDVHALLFTDILLICKKVTKGGTVHYKMIRPTYILDKLVQFPRYGNRNNENEVTGFIYVVLDQHRTVNAVFILSELARDPNSQQMLRTWDQKFHEARITYELSVWFHKNPVNDLSEIETDYADESFKRAHPEDWIIERRARERVAAMLHPNRRTSTEHETTMPSDPFEPGRGPPSLRHPMKRTSTGESSKNSRLSSFQQSESSRLSCLSSFHQSTSGASHEEPFNSLKYLYQAGSSVEHLIPPQNPDDVARSITVNVVSESECETVVPSRQPSPPIVVLQQPSPHYSPSEPRSASAGGSHNTLRVSPQHSLTLVHSLPDLSVEQVHHRPPPPRIQQSASEKLYQSHQELLQKNRLAASQYLSPDQRGSSFPPPSPTRGSLKRGFAFSYSLKYPPLSKMGHVHSQSQHHLDQPQPSTSQMKASAVTQKSDDSNPSCTEKSDKKKLSIRSKTSAKLSSHEPAEDEKSVHVEEPYKVKEDKNTCESESDPEQVRKQD